MSAAVRKIMSDLNVKVQPYNRIHGTTPARPPPMWQSGGRVQTVLRAGAPISGNDPREAATNDEMPIGATAIAIGTKRARRAIDGQQHGPGLAAGVELRGEGGKGKQTNMPATQGVGKKKKGKAGTKNSHVGTA